MDHWSDYPCPGTVVAGELLETGKRHFSPPKPQVTVLYPQIPMKYIPGLHKVVANAEMNRPKLVIFIDNNGSTPSTTYHKSRCSISTWARPKTMNVTLGYGKTTHNCVVQQVCVAGISWTKGNTTMF